MKEKETKEFLEQLKKLYKNEIRISLERSKKPLPSISSKIGGRPVVPDDFLWPYYEGESYIDEKPVNRPLAFLAQINLQDTALLDKDNILPKSGILCFFYELKTQRWGFDPKDKGSARVYYFPDTATLSVADFPQELDDEYRLPEYALSFEQNISIPCDEPYGLYFKCTGFDLESLLKENGLEWWGDSKLLGYPFLIQNPMEGECETVTRGYGCGDPKDLAEISKEEGEDIKEKSKEWVLLFQMRGIDQRLSFGDDGNIYFWIKKQDLANHDFSNVWLILQCY